MNPLIAAILLPLCASILALFLPRALRGFFALAVCLWQLSMTLGLLGHEYTYIFADWAGFGLNFSLRSYQFNSFILACISFFAVAVTFYSLGFLRDKNPPQQLFYPLVLLTLSLAAGVVLADNLGLLLFFWEGILLAQVAMIAIGGGVRALRTASKTFIIVGVSDLCMMVGVALTGHLSGTLEISKMMLPDCRLTSLAFILLAIGAVSKAGALPFHTWIPDAATDAPLPFMAFIPAALEKLLGIYLLARISLDIFQLSAGSFLSRGLMSLGALTIIIAVMMALVQKDYKRLLAYHAISQVGYMLLGIGTCLPAGIIGGLFHMLNNAVYKCGLFFTAGCVQRQANSGDLEDLGGLRRVMPVTFACFLITAASISGMPPFNGFYSKELIYSASLQRGMIFYLAALGGSFFTAISFLKLGHAVFIGKLNEKYKEVKEAPFTMLIPTIVLALVCVLLGLFHGRAEHYFFAPVLAGRHHSLQPVNFTLAIISAVVLAGALIHHIINARKSGSGVGAVDYIHHAPVLATLYALAQKRYFDPYEIGMRLSTIFAWGFWGIDRVIDLFYNSLSVALVSLVSSGLRKLQSGYYGIYLFWILVGSVAVMGFLLSG